MAPPLHLVLLAMINVIAHGTLLLLSIYCHSPASCVLFFCTYTILNYLACLHILINCVSFFSILAQRRFKFNQLCQLVFSSRWCIRPGATSLYAVWDVAPSSGRGMPSYPPVSSAAAAAYNNAYTNTLSVAASQAASLGIPAASESH